MKNRVNTNLPATIIFFALLLIWQGAAMGINAAYILPSPLQVVKAVWEFTVHNTVLSYDFC